jgi:autotransporter strand-loop-strand O-heptosyltransferase
MIYNNLEKTAKYLEKIFFNVNFIMGAQLDIDGPSSSTYQVKFFNHKTNELVYETFLKSGMWSKPSIQYYIQWRIEVWENNELKFEHIFNCENKKIYIHLSSKALGDTIAWFPYIEEFRKEHNCEIICSTFYNDWFIEKYPEIQFINPGEMVYDIYAMYDIGWFYTEEGDIDLTKHPKDVKSYPLQKTASDILGLPYKEIKPNLDIKILEPFITEPYVVIAPHGSKHAAYWNYPGGWQAVIDWLNSQGYKVVMLSRESLGDTWHDSKLGGTLTGIIDKTGNNSFQEVFNIINNSELLIGLGSGLTWISWALNKPTILISGFSDPYTEMQNCIRLSASSNVCGGCFNTHKLDAGDWDWCPHHKNTERHFECSKSIKPEQIIKSLKEVLHIY